MSLISNKISVRQTFGELIGKNNRKSNVTIYSYFISDFDNIIEKVKDNYSITKQDDTLVVISEPYNDLKLDRYLAQAFMDFYITFDNAYTYYSTYKLSEGEKDNLLLTFHESYRV